MSGTYDPILVALSVAIAVVASYTALAMAARVTASEGRIRRAWLVGGSLAMGVGIWSMHFVGMLAFRLPIPMAYDIPLWLLSAAVAVLASLLSLLVVSRRAVGWLPVVGAGLSMGAAIAGMHYIGMAALRAPAVTHYHGGTVALSVAIAVGASFAALALFFRFRSDRVVQHRPLKWVSAAVMGAAISGMHYTAMAAVDFHPLPGGVTRVEEDYLLATDGLAASVVVGAFVVLGLALLSATVDRRRQMRTEETEALRHSEDRFRSLVLASAQIVWTADPGGEFDRPIPGWEEFTGQSFEEYRGSGWLERVHPEDRAAAAAAWREAVAARTLLEGEYRLLRRDGEARHMAVRSVPVLEPDGRVREWVGTSTDITARKQVEGERERLIRALELERSRLARLFQQAPAAIAVTRGPRHLLETANPLFLRLVGGGDIVGKPVGEALPHLRDQGFVALLDRVFRTGEPYVGNEVRVRLGRDADRPEEAYFNFVYQPLHDVDGRVHGIMTHAVEVTQQVRAREQVEEQATELEAQNERLAEARAELERANEELQRANAALARQTAAAEEANAAKSAFLATMSHELRTPLNAISGYAELLALGIRGALNEQQREDVERIRHNQTHLLGLINDVLNFAKIEAGQVQYRIGDVPVDETLYGMHALIEPQVQAKALVYEYRRGDPDVTARADQDRLEQIVLNLLTNAVKFTPAGGRVVLEWEVAGPRVLVRVSDTGRGVPAEKLESIFEPFVQVEPALTRENEGTGLGLAISRDLARAMGGDLTVRSAPGEGSTFTLSLPAGAPRRPVPLAAPAGEARAG